LTNNDVLRRLRYTFDLSDSKMISLFGFANFGVTREQVSNWLKREEDPAFAHRTRSQAIDSEEILF